MEQITLIKTQIVQDQKNPVNLGSALNLFAPIVWSMDKLEFAQAPVDGSMSLEKWLQLYMTKEIFDQFKGGNKVD